MYIPRYSGGGGTPLEDPNVAWLSTSATVGVGDGTPTNPYRYLYEAIADGFKTFRAGKGNFYDGSTDNNITVDGIYSFNGVSLEDTLFGPIKFAGRTLSIETNNQCQFSELVGAGATFKGYHIYCTGNLNVDGTSFDGSTNAAGPGNAGSGGGDAGNIEIYICTILGNVSANGGQGQGGGNGETEGTPAGNSGGNGGNGGVILAENSKAYLFTATGGTGGQGGDGVAPPEGSSDGGDGGDGGNGGIITLRDCLATNGPVSCDGGGGGGGGNPYGGTSGSSGTSGNNGTTYSYYTNNNDGVGTWGSLNIGAYNNPTP